MKGSQIVVGGGGQKSENLSKLDILFPFGRKWKVEPPMKWGGGERTIPIPTLMPPLLLSRLGIPNIYVALKISYSTTCNIYIAAQCHCSS